mgnify:CR=1 FL=1
MEAIELLESGISVFPIQKNSKKPAVSSWSDYQKNLISESLIEGHDGNFAIVTGFLSGITVVDADSADAIKWCEENLPKTPFKVNTPRGRHYYYFYNGESNSVPEEFAENIDIRGEGGYVLAAGSCINGNHYIPVIDQGFESFEDLPKLNFKTSEKPQQKQGATVTLLKSDAKEGGRNNVLSSVAYRLAMHDFQHSEALAILEALNAQQERPLASLELFKLVDAKFKAKREGRLQRFIEVSDVSEYVEKNIKSAHEIPEAEGLIKDLSDYITAHAEKVQPVFSAAASIALLSILSGNIYKFQGIAPNLYLFTIGDTGSGKNHPLQTVKRILSENFNRWDLLGAGKYASSVSMIEGLPKQRQRLDIIDEASAQFDMVSQFGASSFQSSIVETLNELYTSSLAKFTGERSRTHGVTGACWNPFVSIYATSTSEGFKSFFSRSAVAKGIGGRISAFLGSDYPELNFEEKSATLNNKEALAFLAGLRPDLRDGKPIIKELDATKEAVEAWKEYRKAQNYAFYEIESKFKKSLFVREAEQASKFMQLHAIGRDPYFPEITLADLDYGVKMAKYCLNTLYDLIEDNISANKHESAIKEIRAQVRISQPVTRQQLQKELLHLRPIQIDEALGILTDTQQINALKDASNNIYYCSRKS